MINTGGAAAFMWVCVAYIILPKYAGIAAIHILFMIANISAPHVMQLTVTERVWVDNVKLRTSFLVRTCFYRDCHTVWH